jgi:NADH-quinone oxidoreductase subunit M
VNQLGFPLVSLVLWLPTLGALALLFVPRDNVATQRMLAFGVALVTFLVSLPLLFAFNFGISSFQFVDSIPWMQSLGIGYRVSVDGVSLWFVLLTTFMTPLAMVMTWDTVRQNFRTFQLLLLLLESGVIGVFAAQDMFLVYIFFEFTLVPTALLIGMYGGPDRVRAATKAFLYPFAASLFMLLGIIGIYLAHGQQTGTYTFDMAQILASRGFSATPGATGQPTLLLTPTVERLLFGTFFIAFAVKMPLWPFHTWLVLAHEQASSDGSVDVLALLMKLGGYGFIRYNIQLFPEVSRWAAPVIGVLAVIQILYAAWCAFAQTDIKRLLAYSSISHLGFAALGMFALNELGVSGAVFQMISSGLVTGGLFFAAGMIYARRGTRDVTELSGLWKVTPVLGGLTLALVFASIGLPGLSGFIGEYTIMQGAWLSTALGWRFVALAAIGTILAAAYFLHMYQRSFMGDVTPPNANLVDLTPREIGILGALLVVILGIGVYPNFMLGPMQPTMQQIAQVLGSAVAAVTP